METTVTKASSPLRVSIGEPTSLSPAKSPGIDTGQMRSSSPFTPNSFPIHKGSLMSSSPPAAATAGSPLPNETHLSPVKESSLSDQQPATASVRDGAESISSALSDVETFNGKIVYNPDGSAYIIEGPDSDGSEVEAEISQEGSIIDARGLSPNYGSISFPQVVSAFHISRNSELYSALCGLSLPQDASDESKVPEVPVMHSYRVFSLRAKDNSDQKCETENGYDGLDEEEDSKIRAANCSTVPVKPILMCFICKLSFGYTKSFVAHAVGEHHLTLNEEEKRVLSSKNTSAIIQGVGKEKEPLLSFLKPRSSPAPFCTPSQSQHPLEAQRLVAVQMAAVASAIRSNSLSSSPSPTKLPISNGADKVSPTADNVQCLDSPNAANNTAEDLSSSPAIQPPNQSSKSSTSGPSEATDCNDDNEVMDTTPSTNESSVKQSNETASQLASELADLANLEKFAKAAAAAAQQQMDLHSIAAAMAAAVAASNQSQNRTPSPGHKHSPPKTSISNGQPLLVQNQLPTVSNASAFPAITSANAANLFDPKSISLFNSGDTESNNLLATVANHVPRATLTPSHPPLLMQHSRNSCKTLKCPKCNWHYKYQETLEIHMKEKHPENEMNCIYCLTNQPHPRLARGETYTCGYKPYRCDVCNYSTTTKGNLSIHMQSDKHINNVQELQNGNIPATAEHLLQSQALAAAVAQASAAAAAANGNGGPQNTTSNVPTSTTCTIASSNSGSPVPTSSAVNLAAIAAAAAAQQDAKNHLQKMSQQVSSVNTTTTHTPSSTSSSSGGKQKATWRCDVCNYETNVARNLRIHMTSEKHTHNIMVLKQNVTQMQQLSAIQQGIISPEQLLQFNPGLFAAAAAAAAGMNNVNQNNSANENGSPVLQPEVALADMAYNHALLMMASQQQQRTMAALLQQQANNSDSKSPVSTPLMMPNGSQPTFDMEHPDPSLSGVSNPAPYDDSCRLYHCCVCATFTTDSIESLSQHIQCDRTRTREDEVLMSVGGSYLCKLCSYKTNLKANFQLHCKTDKHLQRLQHVNHIKEGGPQAEWKLKFINVSNPVQVRCNVCDYYTNSIHKLQIHSSNPRHDVCSRIFTHLQLAELSANSGSSNKYYHCSLCSASTRTKISLIQHLNSVKHLRNESLRQLKHQQTGLIGMKDSEEEIRDMFQVKEFLPDEKVVFENDDEAASNSIGSSVPESGPDSVLLKNALIEQVAAAQMENKLAHSDSDHQTMSSGINCPFCPYSDNSEIRMKMHILTSHNQQQQESSRSTPPPSILCPLCQEPFQEKNRIENHLVEVHNVSKEGVQRLMLLVDTSKLDKFIAFKQKRDQNEHSFRDTNNSQAEDEDGGRQSESSLDLSAKLTDEELTEVNEMIASGNASGAILEHLLCPTCNRMYLNLDELFSHMSNDSHIKPTLGGQFQCWRNGCGQVFKSFPAVQLHFKEQHFLKCVKLTNSSVNLASNAPVSDRHVYKYRCSQCSLAFKTFEKLQLHSQYHLIRAATQCVICSRSFRSVESLQKHVESSHSDMNEEELEQYKTSLMNNQLLFALGRNGGILDPSTTELLKKESIRCENNDEEPMETGEEDSAVDLATSNNCNKDNDDSPNLEGDSSHLENGGIVNGNSPDNSLEDYLNSQSVAEDNYNDPNRKFKCHRCRVAFTRQSYLTSHNKTLLHRKGEKMSYPMEKYLDPNRPFKCEICKESFTQKNILLVHYNSVSHLHKLKQSMKETSAAVAAAVAASGNVQLNESESEGDNKAFRCNLCKVSYSMASALDSHLRSSMHQTRSSKLHELALSGQLDLSLHLIEPPNTLEANNNNPSKLNANEHNAKSANESSPSSTPNKLPDILTNLTEQQQALAFQQAALNFALATGQANNGQSQLLQMAGQSPFTCSKCCASFISQDAQLQHQQLCGLFGGSQSINSSLASQPKQIKLNSLQPNFCKNKPQLYKHLLETWGFEIVMQFNESNQKKKKPNLEVKQEQDVEEDEQQEEEEEEDKVVSAELETGKVEEEENENMPPEINRCQCDICFKEFSSIWVLKAHREEIHKEVVPLDVVESFADEYRSEYERKFSTGTEDEANESAANENTTNVPNPDEANQPSSQQLNTPIQNLNSSEQISANVNSEVTNNANLGQFLHNLPTNASQAEIAAANQMAAAQLQFGQLLMSMGLAGMAAGMPMQAGMNVPFAAAAAMGIPPQLIPVMMADPMMAAAAAFNNPALAAAAAAQMNASQVQATSSAPGTPSPAPVTPVMPVPTSVGQTPISSQSVASVTSTSAAQQQKRARTRISDEQLKVLRQYFDINNSPTEEQLIEMSQKSGLPMKVIKHWFRNTLFKERQRNKDSPYNFNNPPSTFLNLDEYEKTGEAKVFTLEEIKKSDTTFEGDKEKPKEKTNESESETESKNCSNDFKSSSSTKDTDYATSDDEEVRKRECKEQPTNLSAPTELNSHLQKHQAQFHAQLQQQEFDQLSKAFNINSPQPSESSMSSNSESTVTTTTTTTSSLFAGLANFGSGLPAPQNLASSPLQFALDAAQRSQLAVAAAAAVNTPSMMQNSNSSVTSHSSSGKRANRTRFTDYQIKVLQEFFESNAYPKDDDLEYLSKLLNLSPRVIVVWFQNARQKARKVYENQPPTTPIGEDDGSGRFQRTPGLNYQCKKCLQVFQRYYELIKHQKSSCFKDENPLAAQIRMAAEARANATSPCLSTSRDAPSTPIDCSRSATPEKLQVNLLTSPCSVSVASPTPSATSITNSKNSPNSNDGQTFRCDKCSMVFNRFDLWRDHQIVHIVNTNLFNASAANPFGLMQMEVQTQPQPSCSPQPTISPNPMLHQGTKRKITTDDEDEESHDFDSLSGNGGSNSGDPTPRDKRLRTTILPEQLDYLYQKYQVESNPSRKMLESIAKEVGLKKRVVQVWFQNTRARERKGQFRAHQQVIHKRCPFCRALFKARSALESHLATRHADQYTKGDINIDALPDGDPSEDGDSQVNESNMDSSQMADVMKRYYEDSFKKYLDELNIQGKDGRHAELAMKMRATLEQASQQAKSSSNPSNTVTTTSSSSTVLNPLDLSHNLTTNRLQSNADDEGFDDTRSEEFDSEAEEDIEFDYSQNSNPSSPHAGHFSFANNSQVSNNSHRNIINSNSKRFRTQMTTLMIKVMKSIFADYKTPTMAECEALGRELGLPKRVVQVWFQNSRAKEKKARLAFAKAFGQEFDSNSPVIEQCQICNIKYNYKLSSTVMQEHLFSKGHIEKLKNHIASVKKMIDGQEDNSTDFPVASGHPIPPTMLVNPHSTAPIFPTNTPSDMDSANKAMSFMQQLQLIQGLTAVAASQSGQIPANFNEMLNGQSSNLSVNEDISSKISKDEHNEPRSFSHFAYTSQSDSMQSGCSTSAATMSHSTIFSKDQLFNQ